MGRALTKTNVKTLLTYQWKSSEISEGKRTLNWNLRHIIDLFSTKVIYECTNYRVNLPKTWNGWRRQGNLLPPVGHISQEERIAGMQCRQPNCKLMHFCPNICVAVKIEICPHACQVFPNRSYGQTTIRYKIFIYLEQCFTAGQVYAFNTYYFRR